MAKDRKVFGSEDDWMIFLTARRWFLIKSHCDGVDGKMFPSKRSRRLKEYYWNGEWIGKYCQ